MECLYNEQPTVNCSIRYGNDPTYSNLTNTDNAMADGVINLTSPLTEEITYYIVSTTTGCLTMEVRGVFNTCRTQDLMAFNVTVWPQSSCGELHNWTEHVPLACFSGVTPNSTVMYYSCCGQSNRTCQTNGKWSGLTPSCVCIGELFPTLHCRYYINH